MRLPLSALVVLALVGCDGDTPVATDAALPDAPLPDAALPVVPAPPGFRVRLRDDGRLDLETGGVALPGVDLVLRYADGTERALAAMRPARRDPDTVTGEGPRGETVSLAVRAGPQDSVEVAWSVRSDAALQGVELRSPVTALPPDARVVMDGAQSWSFAGALALAPGATLPRHGDGRPRYPEDLGSPLADAPGLSLLRGDVAWREGGLSACAPPPWDRWTAVSLERPTDGYVLRITHGLLSDERVAGALVGRVVLTAASRAAPFACTRAAPLPRPTRGERPFPRGWWTWNTFFEDVTAARVMAHVPAMRALDPGANHVTVDDGWARAWGDWREREAFGGTIASLAAQLAAQGVTLGLWLAPFLVAPDAPLAAEHPAWLVRATPSELLAVEAVPGRRYHVLDATHPEVRAHLTALFRDLRARGVTLFKIDFLYAGAHPGRRHDPAATGLAAYRLGLAAIAEGAGDAHVNGCGALVLPALPYVDSMRVGADNTFPRVEPFWGAVAAATRNYGLRAGVWDHGVRPDPDQPVVRGYAPDEGRVFLALGALSGALGYGDDLTSLTPAQRALYAEPWFTRLRDGVAAPARALDPVEDAAARFLPSPLLDLVVSGRAATQVRAPRAFEAALADGTRAVALFNWSAQEADVGAPASRFASPPAELVAGAVVRATDGSYRVAVPAHGVRVLAGPPAP